MPHIRYDAKASGSRTDRRWLSAGANLTKHAQSLSARHDIVTVLGPGLGGGAPACFIPATAEIEVDTDVCLKGVSPESVDLSDVVFFLDHAEFAGALAHEAAHARFTRIDLAALHSRTDISRRVVDVVLALEEPRIEYRLLSSYHGSRGPVDRPTLQAALGACAADIVARDFHIASTPYGASIAAALLLARVDGGVLKASDVSTHRRLIEEVIDADTLAVLRSLWLRAFDTSDGDLDAMVEIAREWIEALPKKTGDLPDPTSRPGSKGKPSGAGSEESPESSESSESSDDSETAGPGSEGGSDSDSPSSESDGDAADGGSPSDSDEDDESDLACKELVGGSKPDSDPDGWQAALDEAIREYITEADTKVTEARGKARADRAARDRKVDSERRSSAAATAKRVLGKSHGYSDAPGPGEERFRTLAPTGAMRSGVTALASKLSKIAYIDRIVTKTATVIPPGRLRGKAIVAAAAERERKAIPTVATWSGVRRRHVDTPPLRVGFIQDVSGSMGSAEVPVAVAAWTVSAACRKIDAVVASVCMGYDAFVAIPPGAKHSAAHVYSANAGSEAFKDAFLALDGALDIVDGDGARLLVIASDGHFVDSKHDAYAKDAMRLCKARGVAVVWLDFTGGVINHGFGEVVDCLSKPADEVARLVGDAAIRAFKTAASQV